MQHSRVELVLHWGSFSAPGMFLPDTAITAAQWCVGGTPTSFLGVPAPSSGHTKRDSLVVVVLDHTHLLGFGVLVLKEEVEEDYGAGNNGGMEPLELQTVVAEAVDPVVLQMPVEQVEKEFVLSNFLIDLRLIFLLWMRVVVMLLTLYGDYKIHVFTSPGPFSVNTVGSTGDENMLL